MAIAGTKISALNRASVAAFQSKLGETAINVRAEGASGDGVTNDALAIQAALQKAVSQGRALYFQSGVYMIGGTPGLTNNRLEPTIADGNSVFIYGDGPGNTVIREKEGDTLAFGRFHMMFYFRVGDGVTLNNLIFRDLTLDKNGGSNGPPPTTYAWEQAHAVSVSVSDGGLVRHVLFDNVEVLDKVGGGIVLARGAVQTAIIRNCHARQFSGLFGERGDYEFQAAVSKLIIESCTGSFAQCEPNVTSPPAGVSPVAVFRDCDIDRIELDGYSEAPAAQTVLLENCRAKGKLFAASIKLIANFCRFTVGFASGYQWIQLAEGSRIQSSTLTNVYDGEADAIEPFYLRALAENGGFSVEFFDCDFVPGEGASETTTGYAVWNGGAYAGEQPYRVRFTDCRFSPLYEGSVDGYRNGNFELVRCRLAGRAAALKSGGETTRYGTMLIEDCDFSQCTGPIIDYANLNSLWSVKWKGRHTYPANPTYTTNSKTGLSARVSSDRDSGIPGLGAELVWQEIAFP